MSSGRASLDIQRPPPPSSSDSEPRGRSSLDVPRSNVAVEHPTYEEGGAERPPYVQKKQPKKRCDIL